MSRPYCLLLEPDAVYALSRGGESRVTRVAWHPDAPAPMVGALRSAIGVPSALVVIVSLAFLEIAEPQLPPVSNDVRVRMLQRDSDRYFALREPAAVATAGRVAFAMPSAKLASWLDALSAWSRVQAVVTVAEAAARAGRSGTLSTPAGPGATGQLTIRDGQVHQARRTRGAAPDHDRTLTITELAAGAWLAAEGALDVQLLDAAMRSRLAGRRMRRWWQSAAMAAAALLMLAWSVDRWRERQLVALRTQAQSLELATTSARAAQARLARVENEEEALTSAARRDARADAPAAVLARLGALLPRDAFMQRLEWNGTEWRIDGSASDAAALVPLLDADAQFINVRAAAPSMRYVENGRSRSSFSIVFQTADDSLAARGRQ